MQMTRRQTEVLTLIAEGHSDKEIARTLGMSTKTVSVHLQRVFDKLNTRTRAGAVARWILETDNARWIIKVNRHKYLRHPHPTRS